MEKTTVWTKQHVKILDILEREGRHVAKKEHIVEKMEDISGFYLDVYNWYAITASAIVPKADDVEYPIWVSLNPQSALTNDEDTVVLELELNADLVIRVDYEKWGNVVNYEYIPDNAKDEENHLRLLKNYGIDDYQAYMTGYYPAIKKKIIKSWDRLFENSDFDNGDSGNRVKMGTIWEIKKEWIKEIN